MQFQNAFLYGVSQRIEFFILLYEIRATYLVTYFYFFVQISIWRRKSQKTIGRNTHTTIF